MIIQDKIYGKEEINEPILIELIKSKEIRRLRGISQQGPPQEFYPRKVYSRYEHSIGVLILLRRFGAELKEQIAGLLHDVSHTAFSHVVDIITNTEETEDFQDNRHLIFIKNSEMAKILKKYGFDYEDISKLEEFPLLEKPTPSLCADRVDYALRDINNYINKKIAKICLNDLIARNRQLTFKSKEMAELFAKNYVRLQNNVWASNKTRMLYHSLGNILKDAIKRKIISFEDLNKTDRYIIQLLKKSKDKEIVGRLKTLKSGFGIKNAKNVLELKKKFRWIDPEVLVNKKIKKLSEISKKYKKLIEWEKRNYKKK